MVLSKEDSKALKLVLAKALNKTQLLILSEIDGTETSLSSFLKALSDSETIPLSTLKLGLKTLRELQLVSVSRMADNISAKIELTKTGRFILDLLLEE